MQQYQRIKKQNPDAILFFRLGDFYEMFFDDAKISSQILDLTLTQRRGISMCGVPHFVYRNYVSKLISAGKKVAICDQFPSTTIGKNIIERRVVEVLSPGTITDVEMLDPNRNNYLLSMYYAKNKISFAWIDITTAEFSLFHPTNQDPLSAVKQVLERLSPNEILINEIALEENNILAALFDEKSITYNMHPDWEFDMVLAYEMLCKLMRVINLNSFGLNQESPALYPISVLLSYIQNSTQRGLEHIQNLHVEHEHDYLVLDESTRKSLDLVQNSNSGDTRYTLIEILKQGKTAMGNRFIRKNILAPLCDKEKIEERLEGVHFFMQPSSMLEDCREILSRIQDIERLTSKISLLKVQPKDMLALAKTVLATSELKKVLSSAFSLQNINMDGLEEFSAKIIAMLMDPLPSDVLTMPYIRDGVSSELDEMRKMMNQGQTMLNDYLEEERKKTGIQGLRFRHNRQLGYVFEISIKKSHQVPDYFIHKQSTGTIARFSTEKLAHLDRHMQSAESDARILEQKIFSNLLEELKNYMSILQEISQYIAYIDMLQSFAWISKRSGYIRPQIFNDNRLVILDGRHPVVEAAIQTGEFVPNTLTLGVDDTNFLLITGPNMAGKSTYLRQAALITLMAHIGCYIPARHAEIGLVDRICCRVGASDNLARGESTFLTEMNETSYILRHATDRSLVIMDEVGRGTTMLDGVAIAWAVCEYLLKTLRCRTLFATHYHELTQLEHHAFKNLSLRVEKHKDQIFFSKRIQEGPAHESYGIDVAQLAGLPLSVIASAQQYLQNYSLPYHAVQDRNMNQQNKSPELFEEYEFLMGELQSLQLDDITPLEAMNFLFRLKQELKKHSTN